MSKSACFRIASRQRAIEDFVFSEPPTGIYRIYYDVDAPRLVCARECTIDVHRTSRALRFQFSRRRFHARRIGRHVRRTGMRAMAPARSRRRLWRSAFSSGRRKAFSPGAYRRGSHVIRRLALPVARGDPRRISKSLPLDHADEIARAKRRRPVSRGRNRRTHYGPDLPYRRRRRPAGACAHARRNGASDAMRPATLRSFRPRECLCGIAAAFLPRGRSAQSGRAGDRAQIVVASAGHQWRMPRAAAAARSAGCLHLHSPPSHI